MSLHQFKENECLLTTQKHCPCIEFILAENERHGFHASQLLHYRLETNEGGKDAAPEKLMIAFATAVIFVGGRVVIRCLSLDLGMVRMLSR